MEDRFLVSLGVLSLLAEASEEAPILCCVDDAQWLDGPSAEALLFVARRLEAERIAMLIAVREGEIQRFEAPGIPELELGVLADEDAKALLTGRLDDRPSAEVLSTLLRNAAGNPLALLELPAALSADQLHGAEPILGPPPVRPAVEESFRARVAALSDGARRMLLLAAADEVGDLPAIQDAAKQLGLDGSGLAEAERGGLVRVERHRRVPPPARPLRRLPVRHARRAQGRTRRRWPPRSQIRSEAPGTGRWSSRAPTKESPPSSRRPGCRR